jgi:two-component system, NarL family, response regulator DevR
MDRDIMAEKVTIYLLAANRLLREAVDRIFKRAGFEVVGSTEDFQKGLEEIVKLQPSAVLVNGGAPEFDWPAFIAAASNVAPESPVVLFGTRDDAVTFLRAVCAGAVAYVSGESSASDLIAAIRCAVRGEALCTPRLCLELFKYVRQMSTPKCTDRARYNLTRRERQLLPLISEGLTNKEIAARLVVSELTVKNHVGRILRKTGTHDRFSAVEVIQTSGSGVPAGPIGDQI